MESRLSTNELKIIGGGVIGAFQAYFAYLDAKKAGKKIQIKIYEKNSSIAQTTTGHIVPSLTPSEPLLPSPHELLNRLSIPFTELNGLHVDDVPEIERSSAHQNFLRQIEASRHDEQGYLERTKTLLAMGMLSMQLWQDIYSNADARLKRIFEESNFHPCRENFDNQLQNGYRIDVIYNTPHAQTIAEQRLDTYRKLGFLNCLSLSPDETLSRDKSFEHFYKTQSIVNEFGVREWKDTVAILWHPGGCIDMQVFLPKFYDYLQDIMGTYQNEAGVTKNCFQIKLDRKVVGVSYANDKNAINGLKFFNRIKKMNNPIKKQTDYVFCPGEAVGTLTQFKMAEPSYAGLAGVSLRLHIPLSESQQKHYKNFNRYVGIFNISSTFCQIRIKNNKLFIGIAGTRAYYSDQIPNITQNFAKTNHVLQLNMINTIFPDLISLALGKDSRNQALVMDDIIQLERAGIVERWVGRRAIVYDGFPTFGEVYNENGKVENAFCATEFGSGGVSFSPVAAMISRSGLYTSAENRSELEQEALHFGRSNRAL